MIPYYITFLISCLFCYVGEQYLCKSGKTFQVAEADNFWAKKHVIAFDITLHGKHILSSTKRKKLQISKSFFYLSLSVLTVSILAGLRDYSIGTDIMAYGNDLFYRFDNGAPLFQTIQRITKIEPLYLTLCWISALLGTSPHMLYFLTGLIIYGFVMAGLVHYSDEFPLTLSWLGFLCLLYGNTYNAMRQSLALAIGFWSLHFLKDGKTIKFFLGVVVASFFHTTAIIYIAIYALSLILKTNNKPYIKVLMIAGVILAMYSFNELLTLFINFGIFNAKMERYLIKDIDAAFSLNAILIRLPFLFLILLDFKSFIKPKFNKMKAFERANKGDFYLLMVLMELMTTLMTVFVSTLYRIALYFVMFRCMSYARICKVDKIMNNRIFKCAFLIIYLLIVFIYQNQIKGDNQIYPYTFGDF